ncbi:MAG: DNA ligase [Epsilonproteobacteria bacterium]|nr:DNA ligase [Campylobacterota bacterium]
MAQTKLKTYRKKRDFSRSPEPKNNTPKSPSKKSKGPIFVVQLHHASHKHYDLRLEINRTLVSWAVPKGISNNTKIKRLAIPTENHPRSYARFEGVIPQGNYGAGTVMVWDYGTFKNIKKTNGRPVALSTCLKNGQIEVCLKGKKLHGNFALIKTNKPQKGSWLLVKMKDAHANKAITDKTKSALTGRTMQQIKREAT